MVQENLLDLLKGRHIPTDREPKAPQQRVIGTGFFSVIDGHELDANELANSNLVLGAEGFVYQPVFGEGPFSGQVTGFELAPKWLQEEVLGFGGDASPGRTGPTAAELAIDRSRVQAQNLSTFIQGTIAELSIEIDAGRLETEQALGEFNRRLDAFSEAGTQFVGIQPFTIPKGSKFIPGFEPEGIATRLGLESQAATTVEFDPFSMAAEIVASTPVLTDIGVPSLENEALTDALELARSFVGG